MQQRLIFMCYSGLVFYVSSHLVLTIILPISVIPIVQIRKLSLRNQAVVPCHSWDPAWEE